MVLFIPSDPALDFPTSNLQKCLLLQWGGDHVPEVFLQRFFPGFRGRRSNFGSTLEKFELSHWINIGICNKHVVISRLILNKAIWPAAIYAGRPPPHCCYCLCRHEMFSIRLSAAKENRTSVNYQNITNVWRKLLKKYQKYPITKKLPKMTKKLPKVITKSGHKGVKIGIPTFFEKVCRHI